MVRAKLTAEDFTAAQLVGRYKDLCLVENAFRCLKTVDLKVRPIHQRSRSTFHPERRSVAAVCRNPPSWGICGVLPWWFLQHLVSCNRMIQRFLSVTRRRAGRKLPA